MLTAKVLCLNIGYLLIASDLASCLPMVELRQGVVIGQHKTSYRNRTFSSFQGIPYAEPPVDDLRFREAVPAGPWEDVLYANQSYICPTYRLKPSFYVFGVEDCLYMYVYVPKAVIDKTDNLPVVAYIHGGAFFFGSPPENVIPDYLMDQDIILVTFGYRIGILGFLSTEDDVVPGNNGMKDQTLALRWIKENIKEFGGNPDSITLFGISSGGSSVHLHYLSPWSKGLFHRGYASSGTALANFAVMKNPLENTVRLAKDLNCTTNSSEAMVECLRGFPWSTLMNVSLNGYPFVTTHHLPGNLFGPIVEKTAGGFLQKRPIDLMTSKEYMYDVPWITSVTKDEGIALLSGYVENNELPEMDKKWYTLGGHLLGINDSLPEALMKPVLKQIREYYFKDKPLNYSSLDIWIQMFSDRDFFVPAEQAIRVQSVVNTSPVYFFMFSFLPEHPLRFVGMPLGVAHAQDEQLYFKLDTNPEKLAPREEKEMIAFTTFLAEFALTGIPKIENVTLEPIKPFDRYIEYVEVLGPGEFKNHKVEHLTLSYNFWNSLPLSDARPSFYQSSGVENSVNGLIIFILLFFKFLL